MNGVINVFKEKGMTSFRVVAAIRALSGEKKAGHLGTLDPDAEGVLPVCLGKATKLMGLISDNCKEYRAVMQLGIATDTQDISGNVLNSAEPGLIDMNDIRVAIDSFTGEIMQVPPMYSALKVEGVKLVDAARKGIEIERKPRKRTVFGFDNIDYDKDSARISFTVRCSSGTYIRTLCNDIGEFLHIPSCMYSLIRTETAGLRYEDSYTLDEIRKYASESKLYDILVPTEKLLGIEKNIYSEGPSADKKLYAGNFLSCSDVKTGYLEEGFISGDHLTYDSHGVFTAVYTFFPEENVFKCKKMLR